MTPSERRPGPLRRLFGRSATRLEMLTVAIVVLLVAALFQGYLSHRKEIIDRRQNRAAQAQIKLDHKYDRTTRSICVVLNGVGPIEPSREQRALDKAYRVNHCHQILGGKLAHGTVGSAPQVTPSSIAPTAPRATTVIVHPSARPTATVTKHAQPAPKHTKRPAPPPSKSPAPAPKPTPNPCLSLDLVGCITHR